MTAMIVPQDVVDTQLAECTDGEVGDFTIKGGTFKLVPGVGAVVSGKMVTKDGVEDFEPDEEPEEMEGPPAKPKMSAAAVAVVKRKPSY